MTPFDDDPAPWSDWFLDDPAHWELLYLDSPECGPRTPPAWWPRAYYEKPCLN